MKVTVTDTYPGYEIVRISIAGELNRPYLRSPEGHWEYLDDSARGILHADLEAAYQEWKAKGKD